MKRNMIIGSITVLIVAALAWAKVTTTGTAITGDGALTISSGGSSALTLDSASGAVTLASGDDLTTTLSSDHTSSTACESGYIKVGLWCIDTDGSLATVRTTVTSDEASYTTTVFETGAKIALVMATASATQDGTGEATLVATCAIPGDSAETSCGGSQTVALVQAYLANEVSQEQNTFMVRLDSSAQIKTRCNLTGGPLTSHACNWYKVGYMN